MCRIWHLDHAILLAVLDDGLLETAEGRVHDRERLLEFWRLRSKCTLSTLPMEPKGELGGMPLKRIGWQGGADYPEGWVDGGPDH